MATHDTGTYTAKLTDGPLEGKTVTLEFLESGDPQPRIELPAEGVATGYAYTRSGGLEFDRADDSERPSAVGYRFVEPLFG
jgi:hypothetical protein